MAWVEGAEATEKGGMRLRYYLSHLCTFIFDLDLFFLPIISLTGYNYHDTIWQERIANMDRGRPRRVPKLLDSEKAARVLLLLGRYVRTGRAGSQPAEPFTIYSTYCNEVTVCIYIYIYSI